MIQQGRFRPTRFETNANSKRSLLVTAQPDLKDPRLVLALLEADQVVAAKRRTHFGQRNLSFGVRVLLWGLRAYVVMMLVIVVISALRAMHALR